MLNLPIKILDKIISVADDEQITFSNIDTLVAQWDAMAKVTSRHLVLFINARSIDVSDSITNFLRFNGSAAMDYTYQRLSGVNAAASAGRTDGANAINLPPICGANNVGTYGGSMVLIPHAFNTVNHKVLLALGGASEFTVEAVAGRWASAAAITSVTMLEGVGDDYVVGSEFLLGVVDERYLVEEVDLDVAGTAIFDNIPQGYGDLAIVGFCRSDLAVTFRSIFHSINGNITDSTRQRIYGTDGAAAASANADQVIGRIIGNNATANVFGVVAGSYSQYTRDNQPHFLMISGGHDSVAPGGTVEVFSGRRNNIEPINKLVLLPDGGDFMAGSLFSLYRVPKRLIDRQVLTAPQATITFANIPDYYEALILHVYARTDEAAVDDEIAITLNADAVAANYDWQELTGAAAAMAALRNAASQQLMYVPGDNEGADEFGGGTVLFPNYTRTDGHKHFIVMDGQQENRVAISSHRWESLNAITTIALDPVTGNNFLAGSIFELEGILRKEGLPADAGMRWG